MKLVAGDMLDRYRLVAELGAGGQGSVWRATDTLRPGTDVALKLLRLPGARPVEPDRLRREARALARLEHPSLVRCHGLFEDLQRDVLGLVLDLVDGTPLSDVALDARLDRLRRRWILRHLAAALRALHDASVIHRDLKPANVLVRPGFFAEPSRPENVKLIDLGIAAPTGNPLPLTNPGSVVGTVPYMAPEVIDPQRWGDAAAAGPARDVFAFGVLAMELLRGSHPTGLPRTAKLVDYASAYAAYAADPGAFPPDIRDDPSAILFERCLALRASERAAHGRTLVELLQSTDVDRRGTATARASISTTSPMRMPPSTPTFDAGEDQDRPPPTLREPRSRARWILAASVIPLAGIAAFAVAIPRSDDGPAPMGSSNAPSPLPQRLASAPPATPPPPTAVPAPSLSAALTCADASMILVPSTGRPFCIDGAPVTVEAYARRVGSAAEVPRDAYWPGPSATFALIAEQTKNCRGGKPGQAKLPLNCVDWDHASWYCGATSGRRLPSPEEWKAALKTAGFRPAKGFEWTREHRYGSTDWTTCHVTRECGQGNPHDARNDDIAFRCVSDPR